MKTMEFTIQSHKYQKGVMTYMFNWSLKPPYFQEKNWQGDVLTVAHPAFLSPAGPRLYLRGWGWGGGDGEGRSRGVSKVYRHQVEKLFFQLVKCTIFFCRVCKIFYLFFLGNTKPHQAFDVSCELWDMI